MTMKKYKQLISTILIICITGAVLFGCRKDKDGTANDDKTTDDVTTDGGSHDGTVEELDYFDIKNAVTSVSDLEKLGDSYISSIEMIRAIVNSDTEKLKTMADFTEGAAEEYKNLKIEKWRAYLKKNLYGEVAVYFLIYPTEVGNLDLVPNEWNELSITNGYYRPAELNKTNTYKRYTEAGAQAEILFSNMTAFDLSKEINEQSREWMTCYVIGKFEDAVSYDTVSEYAKLIFGIESFAPGPAHLLENGLYGEKGHGTFGGQHMRVIREEMSPEANNEYKITVQYYADSSKTVKSHTYVYTMKKTDGLWTFTECSEVFHSPYQPMTVTD